MPSEAIRGEFAGCASKIIGPTTTQKKHPPPPPPPPLVGVLPRRREDKSLVHEIPVDPAGV